MAINDILANPAGLNLPAAYGSAMKLAEMKSQYDYEPRKRQLEEGLTLAQIGHLQQQKGMAAKDQKDQQHKEAQGLARGVLSAPQEMRQMAYSAMKQEAINLGHPTANQLPDQLTPEIEARLHVLAYSGETGNRFVAGQEAAAAALGKDKGQTGIPLAQVANSQQVETPEIKAPTPLQEQTPSGVPLPPVGFSAPGAMSMQPGVASNPAAPVMPPSSVPSTAPVPIQAAPVVETPDSLRLKAQAADAEAKRQKSLGTVLGFKLAAQSKKEESNYLAAADRLDGLGLREQAMQDKLDMFKEKQKEKSDLDMTPEVAAYIAKQYIAGDRSVLIGLARNSKGMLTARTAIVKESARQGKSPEEMAATIAEFEGIKSGERTLGNRQAQVGLAVEEARNMAPLALAASEKVDRTQYPLLNKALLAVEQGTGDENVVRFGIAVNSLINIYARAINPVGQVTVSDKDHARELLSTAWSKGQFRNGIDQLQLEMNAAYKAPGAVRKELRNAVTGKESTPGQTREESRIKDVAGGPKAGDIVDKGGVKWKFKGGLPGDKNNWERQ